MNIINEFFVSFILIKLYFKFKVCRKIKFPLLWKFYFSKWKFYFSADKLDAQVINKNIILTILACAGIYFLYLFAFTSLKIEEKRNLII
ncbi:hypothetical protein DK602_03995, partial [Campylobacter jejuni]|nr:hypothetical protein [Campylobacter jejuni]